MGNEDPAVTGERGPSFTWVECPEFDDRPEYGPPCPGIDTHPWHLTVQEGRIALSSGCVTCDEAVMGPVGGEDIEMVVEVVGTLKSHLEVSGWETPEYHHWWEFVPSHLGRNQP